METTKLAIGDMVRVKGQYNAPWMTVSGLIQHPIHNKEFYGVVWFDVDTQTYKRERFNGAVLELKSIDNSSI